MSDRFMGCVGLVFSGLYIWAALLIPESFMMDVVGPSTFPIIIATVMAITSAVFIAKPDPEPHWPSTARATKIALSLMVLVLYAWFLSDLGFVLATTLATAALTWQLGTRPLISLVVGIITALGLYTVFHHVLGLSLATGVFGL